MKTSTVAAIVALSIFGWLSAVSPARAAVVIADLENALMCKCDDECGKVMINCTCDTSQKTREDFRRHLESGLSVEQVIQIYVDKYGETVLSAPTKSGFNLTAWIMPFVAILGGGWGIRQIARTWLKKNSSAPPSPAGKNNPEKPAPASGKYSQQLQDELGKIEL
ncbi:MAG: cytochrome c-type biogenesis protein CcmH [Nitrospinales bacterium]